MEKPVERFLGMAVDLRLNHFYDVEEVSLWISSDDVKQIISWVPVERTSKDFQVTNDALKSSLEINLIQVQAHI